eukprot:NODE_10801_length_1328_cov_5.473772.p1 GENE.NODE_10801_length_1328_cov_5.473772~~NODE_10801_length_1328_cov_5.473772.p1  ORF type:complete len:392 (+),score=118.52 NODE_10801_length_1328_cov_5.473772:60-1235(+)
MPLQDPPVERRLGPPPTKLGAAIDELELRKPRGNDGEKVHTGIGSLQLVLLVALWWSGSCVVTYLMKRTVGSARPQPEPAFFPYPLGLTAATNLTTALICLVVTRVGGEAVPNLASNDRAKLAVLGAFQGVELALNNLALKQLPVSSRAMITSASVLITMTTARCWGVERLTKLRAISATLLACGGLLQALDAHSHSGAHAVQASIAPTEVPVAGALLHVGAMAVASQRAAGTQLLMQWSPPNSGIARLSKVQFAYLTLPYAALVLIAAAGCHEDVRLELSLAAEQRQELLPIVFAIAAGITMLTYAELALIHLTSAVALHVLATLHQIPVLIMGLVLFHERVGSRSVMGFGSCLVGGVLYAVARWNDAPAAAAAVPLAQGKRNIVMRSPA